MIKIAEYLAGGRPVVAFALEETQRMAGGGALYAGCMDVEELARLVAALAQDQDLRASVAAQGAARAHDLVWEESERVLLDLYARF